MSLESQERNNMNKQYKLLDIENLKCDNSQLNAVKNQKMMKAIAKNFNNDLERDLDGRFLYKEARAKDKVPLWSPSRVMRAFTESNLYLIPDNVLNKARNRGVNLMENLEYYHKNNSNIANMNFFEGDKEAFLAINQFIIKNNIKVLAVEKVIHNYCCMGIVDMIIKWKSKIYIVEIKTRTKNEIRESDLFQVRWYSNLLFKAPALIWILDKENQVHCYNFNLAPGKSEFNKYIKTINKYTYLDIESTVDIDE